jgi:hypothetical protein
VSYFSTRLQRIAGCYVKILNGMEVRDRSKHMSFSHMIFTDRRNVGLYLEQHMSLCVCVCVCEREREGEREKRGDGERHQTYAHVERNEDF